MTYQRQKVRSAIALFLAGPLVAALSGTMCLEDHLPDTGGSPPDAETAPIYNNTTDPTNDGASYIGSGACIACHPTQAALHALSGHAHKLKPINGAAPTYPADATRAGVPNPPAGFAWTEVGYVIGGHIRKGRFVDLDGFILTNDADGVDTQWNLDFPPNGTVAGFVPYESSGNFSALNPKPYDHSCFQCHTTGAQEQDPGDPRFQDNHSGMAGTFEEAGVQCEGCHGPGSKHPPNRFERNLYVGQSASACGRCHTRGDDSNVVLAGGGFIRHHEQWPELLASGGHASLNCVDCHNPHASANYDRDNAIIKECTDCHPNQTMALHSGKTFERGGYTEVLSCQSCHMTFATKSAAAASAAVVGANGRMGDIKTHIFRINASAVDFNSMFSADGSQVLKDEAGRAAVTVDFVCLRCHSGVGNVFGLNIAAAGIVAQDMHSK